MDKERAKQLMSIAYIIVANEYGLTSKPIDDAELAKILEENHVTLEELLLLDDFIQEIMEFINDGMV
jgi:hypothetical protein